MYPRRITKPLNLFIATLLTLLGATLAFSQGTNWERFAVVSFNVENLFDTIPNAAGNDREFLPESKKAWTEKRYYAKLNRLAEAISESGQLSWPWIVALQEVESHTVVEALIRSTTLVSAGYQCVVSEGDDPRGLDVALLYTEGLFEVLDTRQWCIPFSEEPEKRSRPILCVSGRFFNGQQLTLLVVHLPSRRGGATKSNKYRRDAVRLLQEKCDSILNAAPQHPIVVMGDFNSTPYDRITQTWASPVEGRSRFKAGQMYDISTLKQDGSMPGSYYFRGVYTQIDRMVVSPALLDVDSTQSALRYATKSFSNVPLEGSMRKLKNGRKIPHRTYGGNSYIGGTSDHFPIRAEFLLYTEKNGRP